MLTSKKQTGFTIVELLIVIVVIGILAAITIVAYNGVQNRAYDTAVKNDLANIGKQYEVYKVENDKYPTGTATLSTLGLRVSASAYGGHYDSGAGTHNLLACWPTAANPNKIAIVARSRSLNTFIYQDGSVQPFTGRWSGSTNTCLDAGVPVETSRDFYFTGSQWQNWVLK